MDKTNIWGHRGVSPVRPEYIIRATLTNSRRADHIEAARNAERILADLAQGQAIVDDDAIVALYRWAHCGARIVEGDLRRPPRMASRAAVRQSVERAESALNYQQKMRALMRTLVDLRAYQAPAPDTPVRKAVAEEAAERK